MEKTVSLISSPPLFSKHLHGRGEDLPWSYRSARSRETPPRTWRRPSVPESEPTVIGNTSTDVEKTDSEKSASTSVRKHLHGRGEDRRGPRLRFRMKKHLHGRGEDCCNTQRPREDRETPPRTWRRPQCGMGFRPVKGKHLHGRGEDFFRSLAKQLHTETPPRTWRRLNRSRSFKYPSRNTSTDVEKTARFSVRLIQPTLLFVVVVVKGGSLTN